MISPELKKRLLVIQQNEITEREVYKRLALSLRNKAQAEILSRISGEEAKHYDFFKDLTGQEVGVNRFKAFSYVFIAKIFGLTFGLKLMEKGEGSAQEAYAQLKEVSAGIEQVIQDENRHESELINLIDEERLKYISSVVLGLNDALVELTGALVGFTFALQNTRLVAIVGLITGIAGSLSMAASEYLSTKQEKTDKHPLKASVYTGIAYVATVGLLISPYLIFKNIYLCLALVVFYALFIILIFTYYISMAKDMDFKKRFLEMIGISLGIAAVNFLIGLIIRSTFGIET